MLRYEDTEGEPRLEASEVGYGSPDESGGSAALSEWI